MISRFHHVRAVGHIIMTAGSGARKVKPSLNVNKMGTGTCSKRKGQSNPKQKYPDFFKVYISKLNSRKMTIPEAFTVYMNNLVPMKAILRRSGRVWEVKMVRTGGNVVFQEGWEGFAKTNTLQNGNFLVFSYVGDCMFDVVIFGNSKCVKEEAGDRKLPEVKEEQADNDDDRDYVLSEGLNGEQEEVEEEHDVCVVMDGSEEQDDEDGSDDDKEYVPSNGAHGEQKEVEEEHEGYVVMDGTEQQDDDDDYIPSDGVHGEQEELEEDCYVISNEDAFENMNNLTEEEEHNDHDAEDADDHHHDNDADDDDDENEDNNKWQCARRYLSDERNPFFFTKLRPRNRSLYVPAKVVRDFNLEFPSKVSILDPLGRKWGGPVMRWNDGRTWIRGWMQFCTWNGITPQDICICEILEGAKCILISKLKV